MDGNCQLYDLAGVCVHRIYESQGMYRLDIGINNISVLHWFLNLWWFRCSVCGRDIFHKSMGFLTAELKNFFCMMPISGNGF